MGKTLLWVVAALALGGAAFFLLGGMPEDCETDSGIVAEAGVDAAAAGREGVALVGASRVEPLREVAAGGTFRIRGRVLDAKDAPLPGVRVGARLVTPGGFDPNDRRTWGSQSEDRLRRTVADLDAPLDAQPKPDAVGASGDDGRFELRVDVRGSYEVRALVEPPMISSYGYAYFNAPRTESDDVTVRVVTGHALQGRVVDASGNGVLAAVTGSHSSETLGSFRSDAAATSLPEGTFALGGLVAGKWSFSVRVPGRMTVRGGSVDVPHEGVFVIRLDEGGAVRGRVVDLQGKPIPAATVLVTLAGATARGVTGEDGTYRVDGVPPGRVTEATAHAPGFVLARAAPPLAPWSGAEVLKGKDAVVDFVLEAGGTIEGRVVEAGTGKGIAGAVVVALPPYRTTTRAGTAPVVSASGPDGSFRLAGVAAGRSILVARAAGYYLPAIEGLPSNNQWRADGVQVSVGAPAEMVVVIPPEGGTIRRDVTLAPGLTVSGRVLGPDDQPVEGAEIIGKEFGFSNVSWQFGTSWGIQEPLGTSGPDGTFEARGMPPRPAWVIFARKNPYVGVVSESFPLEAGSSCPPITLRLTSGATIEGVVLDEHATPVSGANVNAWSQAMMQTAYPRTYVQTDAAGTFRFEGIAAGTVTLNVSSAKAGGKTHTVERLLAGEVRKGIEIRLEAGSPVSGSLFDPDGKPAVGKAVFCSKENEQWRGQSNSTTTKEDGSFTIAAAPAGRVRLFLQQTTEEGYGSSVPLGDAFEAPARGLRFTVPPEAKTTIVEGTVLDAAGMPVPLCTVSVRGGRSRREEGMNYGPGGPDQNEVANGRFRRAIKGDPPFEVKVTAPRDAQGRPLNLKPGSATVADPGVPAEIRLEPGVEISGRVLDDREHGMPQAVVRIGTLGARVERDGTFRLGGMTEGEVDVSVFPPPDWVTPTPVKARTGDADVVFRLTRASEVAGTVRDPRGEPYSGNGWINASWQATPTAPAGAQSAQIDEGRFRIRGVPPDAVLTLMVQVWSGDGGGGFAPITMTDVRAGTRDVDVRLESGLSIEGVVLDAEGKPFTQGNVMATEQNPAKQAQPAWGNMGPDGKFRIQGLKAATYTVQVQRHDGGPAPAPTSVQAPNVGVRIQMPKAEKISGRLVGDGDLSGWQVWVWAEGAAGAWGPSARSNADGTFTVDNVGTGSFLVGAKKKDEDRYGIAGPVQPGAKDVSVSLVMGESISGTVETPTGPAPKDTQLTFVSPMWTTWVQLDATGAFRLRGLPRGRYKVSAWYNSQYQENVDEIDSGRSGVRIRLR